MAITNTGIPASFPSYQNAAASEVDVSGEAPKTVLRRNPARLGAIIQNIGNNAISLSFGTSRVGLVLQPMGTYEITLLNLFTGEVSGLSVVGSTVSAIEFS